MSCIKNTINQTTSSQATKSTSTSSFAFAPEPEVLRITRTVLFSLIAALALIGNYVVCRAVWRHPGVKPIAHYFVSNLAVAEILSMVCLVFTFHAYEPPWSWKLGNAMCKILPPLQIASQLVITTTLAILAVYRCVLLIKPLIDKPTCKQTRRFLLVSWVGSVGLAIPAGHFRVVNSYGDNCDFYICQEVFPEGFKHYQDIYSVVLFVINYALPLVIMAISYSLVRRKIREHIFVIQRLRDEQSKALSSFARPSTCMEEMQATGEMNQLEHKNQMTFELIRMKVKPEKEMAVKKPQRKIKFGKGKISESISYSQNFLTKNNKETFELENDLLKMVYALVLIFVVCYIPFQVNFLMVEFKVQAFIYWPYRHIFRRLVFTLTCLPSALHPVCYGLMSRFYRRAFIRMIACRASK